MKKILVTGATGFLGYHIVERLHANGYQVRCIVRNPVKAKALAGFQPEVVCGDLTDAIAVDAATEGTDGIIHAAAVLGGWGGREHFIRNNLDATRNVIEAAVRHDVKRFIYVSSAASYGLQPRVKLTEESPAKHESEPYCETKRLGEELVQTEAVRNGIKATVVRPSIVYGPNDYRFLPPIVDNIKKGTMVAIGERGQGPPLVYVKDVADFLSVILTEQTGNFEVFNLSTPEKVSWETIIQSIGSALGIPVTPRRIPFRLAYGVGSVLEFLWKLARAQHPPKVTRFIVSLIGLPYDFDSSKALNVDGFQGFTPFARGLEETLQWMDELNRDNVERKEP